MNEIPRQQHFVKNKIPPHYYQTPVYYAKLKNTIFESEEFIEKQEMKQERNNPAFIINIMLNIIDQEAILRQKSLANLLSLQANMRNRMFSKTRKSAEIHTKPYINRKTPLQNSEKENRWQFE